jgi:asparagine synthase (glutamine-hydrolysing)
MVSGSGTLKAALDEAVRGAVQNKRVAIAFSGGLDSGIIAAMAREYAEEAMLYTVGSEDSHDLREAVASAKELGMHLIHIPIGEDEVINSLREMIKVTGTKDPVVLSFELPLFQVCKNCREADVLSGQGADELFAGYSKYVGLDRSSLEKMIEDDVKKLNEVTLVHESRVADHFGKNVRYPFLDSLVMQKADEIDVDERIPGDDPMSRKKALRDVAEMMGCISISLKGKKAAQYGSGAMAIIKKICRDRNMTYSELIEALSEEAE